jgi:RHS repeat-associated protein
MYRVVSDHLGSPRRVVNVANSSDVPFSARYSSFGEVTGSGLEWMPFGFAGGVYDDETRLVRFGVRDVDTLGGRWTQKDPGRWNIGDLNLYLYSYGDPVNYIDNDGRNPVLVAIAIGIILFGDTGCTGSRCADLAKAENDEKNACKNIGGNPPDSGGLLGPNESAPTSDEADQARACTDARKKTAIARAKCVATQGR